MWPRSYTLGHYPRETETYDDTKTHIRMFTALVIVVTFWRKFQWPSVGAWVMKLCCSCNGTLLINEKNGLLTLSNNLDELHGCNAEQKWPILKSHKLHDPIWSNHKMIGIKGILMVSIPTKKEHVGSSWWCNSPVSGLWRWVREPTEVIKLHRTVHKHQWVQVRVVTSEYALWAVLVSISLF